MLRSQHLPSSTSGAGTAGFYSTQDADPTPLHSVSGTIAARAKRAGSLPGHRTRSARSWAARPPTCEAGETGAGRRDSHGRLWRDPPRRLRRQENRRIRPRHGAASCPDRCSPQAVLGPREACTRWTAMTCGWRERQLPSSGANRVAYTAAVPLLRDRGLEEGQAAAHVCRDFACQSHHYGTCVTTNAAGTAIGDALCHGGLHLIAACHTMSNRAESSASR